MSALTPPDLSLTEWVVLALLVEGPSHGFAIARELKADSDLGRVMTVQRPLVYRALDRLDEAQLAEPVATEPGDGGPQRTVRRPTRRGRARVNRWLDTPVAHVRDLRIEFLVKLRLNQRRDRSAASLVRAQRTALAPAFAHLVSPSSDDVVDRWRHRTALAAQRFLDDLAADLGDG